MTALGVGCGSREMFLHAEIARCSLVTMSRRLHLLRPGRTATEELYARDAAPSDDDRYRAFIEDEGKLRLGWGIFVSVLGCYGGGDAAELTTVSRFANRGTARYRAYRLNR